VAFKTPHILKFCSKGRRAEAIVLRSGAVGCGLALEVCCA
jgi:hypothetical protein